MSAVGAPANVDALINRLEYVQQSGKGWRAACPACGTRSRKLSISESDDGRILLHCFAGCSAAEVVQAAGLTLADLFPERVRDDTAEGRTKARRAARESQWGAALALLEVEARIVLIAAGDIAADKGLDWNDYCRLVESIKRIESAAGVLRDQPRWRS